MCSIACLHLVNIGASDVCIIINNLHPDIKQEDLWNYFDQYGTVKQISFHRTKDHQHIVVKPVVIFSQAI